MNETVTESTTRCDLSNPPLVPEGPPTLILGEEGTAVEYVCTGPGEDGRCPLDGELGAAGCAGRWVINQGWSFKVAPDARGCPLTSLGLAGPYQRVAGG